MKNTTIFTFSTEAFEKLLDCLERIAEDKLKKENTTQDELDNLNCMIDYLAENYGLDSDNNLIEIELSQKRIETLFNLLFLLAIFYYDAIDYFDISVNICETALKHNDAAKDLLAEAREIIKTQSLFIKELMEEN